MLLPIVLQHLRHVVLHLVRVELRIVRHMRLPQHLRQLWLPQHLRQLRLRQHLRQLRMQLLYGRHGGSWYADHGAEPAASHGADRAAGPGAGPAVNHAVGHGAHPDAKREIATASPPSEGVKDSGKRGRARILPRPAG